jgi:2-keto-3-deoxy-L-rhamnonate aldolase RhmA
LTEGRQVFGLFCSVPAPLMVEMIGHAGFDFVIIDTEHASVNPETLENMIRAAEAIEITPFVRVAEASHGAILRALDAGAQGVVVPHIRTKQEAELSVKSSRYFPEGMRSLNGGRPAGFGKTDLQQYIRHANEEIMVIPMIEDREGVDNLDEILSVPGIDLVLEGAADLSQSYGIPWQTRSDTVREAVKKIHRKSLENHVHFCALPRAAEDFKQWTEKGVQAFVLGDERGISYRAMRDLLQSTKKEAGSV